MDKAELNAVLTEHRKWLRDPTQGRWANLRWADLRGANLRGADLSGADLRWADLRGANLRGADLSGADLPGANLSGANLHEANLRWANLRGADLSGADLRGANLSGADLSEADLRGSKTGLRKINIDALILHQIDTGTGTINMDSWHTCQTTHCRAGWAATLHPDISDGFAFHSPAAAAALVYAACGYEKTPEFYNATDAEALADMRKCAEEWTP